VLGVFGFVWFWGAYDTHLKSHLSLDALVNRFLRHQ